MSIRPAAQKAIDRIDHSDLLSDDRWLTQTELAYKLGVSFRSVSNWTTAKLIPYYRLDVMRFDLAAVRRALERFIVHEVEPS
jgi:hypothetical protein